MYAESREALDRALVTVDEVSEAVGMTLGLKKCAAVHIQGGNVVDIEDHVLPGERDP